MAGTSTVENIDVNSVWGRKITYTFASGDTAEVKQVVEFNGELRKIISVMGSASGANPTGTVAIDDLYENEIYSAAALAEGSTTTARQSDPNPGHMTVGLTPSTDPLSAWVSFVYLLGAR